MVRWCGAAALVVAVAGLLGCSSSKESPADPMPAAVLQGPRWRLTMIGGQPVLAGTTVTAEFSSESRVAGAAGCNHYSGSARAEAGRLEIGPLASTMMACVSEAVMLQEERYLAALEAATHYAVDGTELRLGTSTTDVTLVFSSR